MRQSIIRRDGKEIARVPTEEVLPWFHKNTSASMDWALQYEGWSVEDIEPTPAEKVREYEAQTTGSVNLHQHWTKRMLYTDGMLYLAETVGAHWLIDLVASHQPEIEKRFLEADHRFQVWEVQHIGEDWEVSAWTDTPRIEGSKRLARQVLEFSDFPEELCPFQFYVVDKVAMLKREY